MEQQKPQPDQQILALTKAIRQKESGGNYSAIGDNGTSRGAYQYQPNTWRQYSKEILGDENAEMSEANQNAVTYGKIKQWRDQGMGPAQIAAAWNAGPQRALDGSWANHIGTTTRGGRELAYNTPQYVKDVVDIYRRKSQGNAPTAPRRTFSSAVQQIQEQNPQVAQAPQQNLFGANKNDSTFGKLTNNSFTRGLINLVPGAKTLGESIGTAAGAVKAKAKDITTGSKEYENYDLSAPSPVETAKAGAKVVATAGAIKGAGGLIQRGMNMLRPTPAMQNPEVVKALRQSLNPGQGIESLTRRQAISRLTAKLENLKTSEIGGPLERALLQALKELQPVAGEVKRGLLQRILSGDKVGVLDLIGAGSVVAPLIRPVTNAVKEAATGTGRFQP